MDPETIGAWLEDLGADQDGAAERSWRGAPAPIGESRAAGRRLGPPLATRSTAGGPAPRRSAKSRFGEGVGRHEYDFAMDPERIGAWLEDLGAERRGEREWVVRVPSTKRGALAVLLTLGERTLSLRAFYMRGPDRRHEQVYRRLLRKGLEPTAWRFALDDDGDIHLLAQAPLAGLSEDALDRLLGSCAAQVDETWEGVLRTGFEVPEGTVVAPPPGEGP
jgi:putative sensory transduction regulator